MYLHVVNPKTQTIFPISHVLKVIDAKYDFLKHYYAGVAIENVVVCGYFDKLGWEVTFAKDKSNKK